MRAFHAKFNQIVHIGSKRTLRLERKYTYLLWTMDSRYSASNIYIFFYKVYSASTLFLIISIMDRRYSECINCFSVIKLFILEARGHHLERESIHIYFGNIVHQLFLGYMYTDFLASNFPLR